MDEKLETLIDKLSLLLIAPEGEKKKNITFKRTTEAVGTSTAVKSITLDDTKKNRIQTKCNNNAKKYQSQVIVMPNNIADEVKMIHGIPLAADLKSNYYLKLDNGNAHQALTIMDLEREGLTEYKPYIKNPSTKSNQVVSFNNHISVTSLNSSIETLTSTSSSSSSSTRKTNSAQSNKSINNSINNNSLSDLNKCPILKNKIKTIRSDHYNPRLPRNSILNMQNYVNRSNTTTTRSISSNSRKEIIKQVSFKEYNNHHNNNDDRCSISTIPENISIMNPIDKSTPLPSTPLPPPLNYVLNKISSLHNKNNTLDTVPNTPAAYSTPIPVVIPESPDLVFQLPVVSLPPLPLPMSKTPPTKITTSTNTTTTTTTNNKLKSSAVTKTISIANSFSNYTTKSTLSNSATPIKSGDTSLKQLLKVYLKKQYQNKDITDKASLTNMILKELNLTPKAHSILNFK